MFKKLVILSALFTLAMLSGSLGWLLLFSGLVALNILGILLSVPIILISIVSLYFIRKLGV